MNLTLCSTPIGNISDCSSRVLEAFNKADVLICEDTRSTKDLFKILNIDYESKNFFAFHEHNQVEVENLITKVLDYEFPVLVSDAGSPVISDPGFPFVKKWLELGHDIGCVPGPSAVQAALELSGLPPLPYMFHGFLPKKKEAKKGVFKSCANKVTHIFFESPHRIHESLLVLGECLPHADISVSREITKMYESTVRFKGSEVNKSFIEEKVKAKGEFVFSFHVAEEENGQNRVAFSDLEGLVDDYIKKPTPKKLAKVISKIKGIDGKEAYNLLISKTIV